ncbi:hypothetical protein [Cylindrospermum sp. FACHB-282]|uniref:hypothetical protein n=1 Tax=Cylindrospermum sp. FACHB-282 TaxID=2692794 RepID=UPI0016884171|nr:hypothetical protein [Cylindrospermum sp. FACHB-282]MBD2388017.1 hypothetical protein [Cylindrospermum sp. FACHB-282]
MKPKGQLELPPDSFISPLLELRDYYVRLVEEHERLFIQARSQLEHVEALLSNWYEANGNQKLSRLEAVNGGNRTAADKGPLLLLSPDSISDIDMVDSLESEVGDSDDLEMDNSTSVTEVEEFQLPIRSPESHDNSIKGPEVPMLLQYQALSRMEAIKKLLQDYMGSVCHIDFIVRSLYGELEPYLFKVVKGRVQSSLTQGRERGVWEAIPYEPGCYTLDLSMVNPTNGNGTSMGVKPKKKKPYLLPKSKTVPLLRAFEGLFLIDAITSFLEQNPGIVFSVAEIVMGIYGELDSQQLREVKNKVLNELSRGHRTGRFSRVPDKIGFYQY